MNAADDSRKNNLTQAKIQTKFVGRLVNLKATNGFKNVHFLLMILMVILFICLAYLVFHNYYDVYVIFLFAPLIYSAIVYRLKGAIIGSIIFISVLVPHVLPLSFDTYGIVRSFVYLFFPFLVSTLVALSLNYFEDQMEGYEKIVVLNETLNSYVERLERTQKQLVQVEKMNALGQLSASIAHEINNPLSGLLIYTQLLQKLIKNSSLDRNTALDILSKMELAITHSSKLVSNLLDFARQTTPDLKPIAISKVIDQAVSLTGHQAQLTQINIIREEVPSLPLVKGDLSQLQQVLINLIVNAIQSMPRGGELKIVTFAENDFVKVNIQDTGEGIAPENMDKLFTPFFSTKDAVKGVGLGLAVSYGIIQRHGGNIEVQSQIGKGSTFSVCLPAYRE